MSGSGYDQSVTTFSPEGRIYQVEYATKAVEISETVVGIRCKDGVLLAAEKQRFSRLLVDNSNRRINSLEAQIGVALVGKLPDARAILQRAKTEAADYLKNFAIPVTGSIITERLALFVHQFTVYGIGRPFGAAVLISSYNEFDGFQLHMVEPSGHSYSYYACAHGKGRSICKSEIERRNFREITCAEAYVHLAKMLILSHEEFKDKKFEYEITEISKNTGYQHVKLPQQVIDQAVAEAERIIEQDQIGE